MSHTDVAYSPDMRIQILPSLLAADFGNLEAGARRAEAAGGDALHIDVMDGHFVPNISMGPAVVEMARHCVKMPLSVHLMITEPDRYIGKFIDAGADSLLIHIESKCDVAKTLDMIRELGARPGITLNPETPVGAIFPVMGHVDEVLCMTVHPGFGGQEFMREVLPKVRAVRNYANSQGMADLDILVDGGIDLHTVSDCAAHGANVFVAGSSLYHAFDMAAEVDIMRRNATESLVAG
jgi:ribulose-phosphate 3-epimerase